MNSLERQPHEPNLGQEARENMMPDMEIFNGVFRVLESHGVPESEYVHYLNRAILMAQTPGTFPEEAIHKEIHSDPAIIAEPPFTGWGKRPGGNA